MVSATSYGEVLQIRMSRYPDFPTGTWVCAYLVDSLLFDPGLAHTAEEMNRFLSDKVLKLAINSCRILMELIYILILWLYTK
jgi:hypothetical protein